MFGCDRGKVGSRREEVGGRKYGNWIERGRKTLDQALYMCDQKLRDRQRRRCVI